MVLAKVTLVLSTLTAARRFDGEVVKYRPPYLITVLLNDELWLEELTKIYLKVPVLGQDAVEEASAGLQTPSAFMSPP